MEKDEKTMSDRLLNVTRVAIRALFNERYNLAPGVFNNRLDQICHQYAVAVGAASEPKRRDTLTREESANVGTALAAIQDIINTCPVASMQTLLVRAQSTVRKLLNEAYPKTEPEPKPVDPVEAFKERISREYNWGKSEAARLDEALAHKQKLAEQHNLECKQKAEAERISSMVKDRYGFGIQPVPNSVLDKLVWKPGVR